MHLEMIWKDLNLSSNILSVLLENNFVKPLDVQTQIIPMVLQNEDVIVQSETGSGKTLAYIIPILQKLQQNDGKSRILIVAPTKVLIKQIEDVLQLFKKFMILHKIKYEVVIGGNKNRIDMENAQILLGTPGRLAQFVMQPIHQLTDDSSGKQQLQQLNFKIFDYLILDEFDKLIQMQDLKTFIFRVSSQCKKLLFSATIDIQNPVIQRLVPNYSFIKVQQQQQVFAIPETLQCWYVKVNPEEKLCYLYNYIFSQHEKKQKTAVFCLTCAQATYFNRVFEQLFPEMISFILTGEMSSQSQLKMYNNFVKSDFSVLFTTDIAARGLDIDGLSAVLQFDLPKQIDNFVHRAGRTGRASKQGTAGAFLMQHELGIIDMLRNRGLVIDEVPKEQLISQSAPIILREVMQRGEEIKVDNSAIAQLKAEAKRIRKLKEVETAKSNSKQSFQKLDMELSKVEAKLKPFLDDENQQKALKLQSFEHPLLQQIRQLSINDRYFLDLCQRQYVSYYRGYSEYQLKVILDVSKVEFGLYGVGCGMLVLPNIAELRGKFILFKGYEGNLQNIQYKNQQLEEQRLSRQQNIASIRNQLNVDDHDQPTKQQLKKERIQRFKDKQQTQLQLQLQQTGNGALPQKETGLFSKEKKLIEMLRKGLISEQQLEDMLGQ